MEKWKMNDATPSTTSGGGEDFGKLEGIFSEKIWDRSKKKRSCRVDNRKTDKKERFCVTVEQIREICMNLNSKRMSAMVSENDSEFNSPSRKQSKFMSEDKLEMRDSIELCSCSRARRDISFGNDGRCGRKRCEAHNSRRATILYGKVNYM